ncbi:hypothetical protein NHX12_018995, partial [Muraenolepis orangiensis]
GPGGALLQCGTHRAPDPSAGRTLPQGPGEGPHPSGTRVRTPLPSLPGPHPSGPHPSGTRVRTPLPSLPGPHPSGPHPSAGPGGGVGDCDGGC